MAKQQQARKEQKNQRDESPNTGTMRRGESLTGERDVTYNLISVLYHSLQGAETVAQYLRDAEQSQDEEIRDFLQQVHQQYIELAQQGKALLAERLELDEEGDDEEDEEEE